MSTTERTQQLKQRWAEIHGAWNGADLDAQAKLYREGTEVLRELQRLIGATCPDCDGDGEVVASRVYSWYHPPEDRTIGCHRCAGTGKVFTPVQRKWLDVTAAQARQGGGVT